MKSLLALITVFSLLIGCASTKLSNQKNIEQENIAIQFQDAMNQSDVDVLADLIDTDNIISETIKSMDASPTETVAMWFALRSVLSAELTGNLIDGVESSEGLAEYRGRTPRGALVRLNMMDQGLVYLELIINDKSKVADIFSYSDGRLVSEKLFSVMSIFNDDSVTLKDKTALKEGIKLYKEKDFSGAFLRLNSLLETVKSNAVVGFLLLGAGSHDEGNHVLAMQNFRKYHIDNPDYDFVLIDHYITEKNYSEALKSIQNVDDYLGNKDGFIALMKFNVYMLLGDVKKARLASKQAESREPENEFLLLDLLDLYISYEMYEESVSAIEVLNSKFKYELTPDILKEAGYDAFAKSDVFSRWEQAFK